MRALALLSGGLDSQLAVRVMQRQGIDVVGVHFFHRFNRPGDPGSWPDTGTTPRGAGEVEQVAACLGIEVVLRDFSTEFLAFVNKPRHGRGKGFNPCVDCKITMLTLAKEMMDEHETMFVCTGEVLGQRPMTQVRHRMNFIAKQSGLGRLLLRPLSAQRMTPTVAEERGWVDRERLLALHGRGRKAQMALAAELGIADYPQPAGGCFLTDGSVATRFFSWVDRLGSVGPRELMVFRMGRHFTLPGGSYVVAGRDERENGILRALLPYATRVETRDHPGASVFVLHQPGEDELKIAGAMAARYSKLRDNETVVVTATRGGSTKELVVHPLDPQSIEALRV
ncbi:hypothetical protein JXA88_01330 [Candidatus Fermentibacteria bacterium]|nr:hypothetical protein [Candidatus Fermentibacteria bacterium]